MNRSNLHQLIRILLQYDAASIKQHEFSFESFAVQQGRELEFPEIRPFGPREIPEGLMLDPVGMAYVYGIRPPEDAKIRTWFAYAESTLLPVTPGAARAPFDWCFAYHWQDADPTPLGCAKRIALIIDPKGDGLPPITYRAMATRNDYAAWRAAYAEVDLTPYQA